MDMNRFLTAATDLFLPYKFGFIMGHSYVNNTQVKEVEECLDQKSGCQDALDKYEDSFASLVGSGRAVSFAAGRMAFFSFLKLLEIKPGDEIILPAFTCSVMPNAVWRSGARPVFTDIDPDTFGSSPESIEKAVTDKTRIIVAQHSFGIPCRIKDIMDLAKKRGIFVIEDCAITLDSSIEGIKVGDFGDAAFFSTNHTKPLNTIIGGVFYSNNNRLFNKVKAYRDNLPDLDINHQKRLYSQFLFERSNACPDKYPRLILKKFMKDVFNQFRCFRAHNKYTFLEADYSKSICANLPYPYPAKLPEFLAKIGLFELNRWQKERAKRKSLLQGYLAVSYEVGIRYVLPKAYFNDKLDIVPLRFVFKNDKVTKRSKATRFIDSSQTWFRQPIICCPEGAEKIGYIRGSSPESESVCKSVENWPCAVPESWMPKIIELFRSTFY